MIVVIFADDYTFLHPLYKMGDNSHIMESHNVFVEWCTSKDLKLNVTKTKMLSVRKPTPYRDLNVFLPEVQSVQKLKILGVFFNSSFTWNDHIDFVVHSASSRLYAIRKLKPLLSHDELKLIYSATVRSILEYCSPLVVGMPAYLQENLERIQKRFHNILCGFESECSAQDCLPSLSDRRSASSRRLLKQVEDDPSHILHPLLPPVSQRSGRYLHPAVRTERRKRTFFNFFLSPEF